LSTVVNIFVNVGNLMKLYSLFFACNLLIYNVIVFRTISFYFNTNSPSWTTTHKSSSYDFNRSCFFCLGRMRRLRDDGGRRRPSSDNVRRRQRNATTQCTDAPRCVLSSGWGGDDRATTRANHRNIVYRRAVDVRTHRGASVHCTVAGGVAFRSSPLASISIAFAYGRCRYDS
jgi:hypothetical protein